MFHIRENGAVAKCTATSRACPRGGAQSHFETAEEGRAYYERARNGAERGAPTFSPTEERYTFQSSFKLDEDAKLETKNKGEFLELYVPYSIVEAGTKGEDEEKNFFFKVGSKAWAPKAMRVGVNDYRVDDEGEWFVETADQSVVKLHPNSDGRSSETMFADVAGNMKRALTTVKGAESRGNAYLSTPNIQSTAVKMGFTDGKVPKAVSTAKADLIAWDEEGKAHRISIKSYMNGTAGTAAILNASESSSIVYSSKKPGAMSEEAAEALAKELSNKSSLETVAGLRRAGVNFSVEQSAAFNPELESNLRHVSPLAAEAYKTRLLEAAGGDARVTPELEAANQRSLVAFATRMTPTKLSPKSEAITDFATIHSNGKIEISNFNGEDELSSYINNRADLSTGSNAKVTYEDGEFKLTLYGAAALTLNKKTTRYAA